MPTLLASSPFLEMISDEVHRRLHSPRRRTHLSLHRFARTLVLRLKALRRFPQQMPCLPIFFIPPFAFRCAQRNRCHSANHLRRNDVPGVLPDHINRQKIESPGSIPCIVALHRADISPSALYRRHSAFHLPPTNFPGSPTTQSKLFESPIGLLTGSPFSGAAPQKPTPPTPPRRLLSSIIFVLRFSIAPRFQFFLSASRRTPATEKIGGNPIADAAQLSIRPLPQTQMQTNSARNQKTSQNGRVPDADHTNREGPKTVVPDAPCFVFRDWVFLKGQQ